jgi:malate permease and related proteins
MQVLGVFAEVMLPVLLVAAVGGAAGRRLRIPVETLADLVFFVFSPALVFVSIADIELAGGEIVRIVAVVVAVFAANLALAVGWSRLRRDDARTAATGALAASLPNHGNLGLPIAALALGDAGLRVAVVAFTAGASLQSSAGVAVGSAGRVPLRQALVSPLRYPALYAAAAGVVVNAAAVELPTSLAVSTASLADAAIPCMLTVLGMQFHWPRVGHLLESLAASTNRLLVGPLVAWLTATALGLDGTVRAAVLISSAMPTAVMVTILAAQLGGRTDLAVRAVVVSTLLSLITLTVLVAAVT